MSDLSQTAREAAVEWQTVSPGPIADIAAAKARLADAESSRTANAGAMDFLGWAQEQLLSGVRDRSLDKLRARETANIAGLSDDLMRRAGPMGEKLLSSVQASFSDVEQEQYSVLTTRVEGAQGQYHDRAGAADLLKSFDERLDGIIENADSASWAFSAMAARAPGQAHQFEDNSHLAIGQARGLNEALERVRNGVKGATGLPAEISDSLDALAADKDIARMLYGDHPTVGQDQFGRIADHMHMLKRQAELMKEKLKPTTERVAAINAADEVALNEALEARTVMEAGKLRELAGDEVADQLDSFWQWNERATAQRLKAEPVQQKRAGNVAAM
ncbi:MAG: hypothetical protein Alpg2KO_19280 [Alphaproteobacteria bacterium]